MNKGQTLFEVVLALGIAVILISGIVVVSITSVRNSRTSTDAAKVGRFAQEAMEWLKQEKSRDWVAFSARAGNTYCISDIASSWPGAGACLPTNTIPGTPFSRSVTLSQESPGSTDSVKVEVVVSWEEGGATRTAPLTSIFTNWR